VIYVPLEKFGAGSGAKGVEALPESALELVGSSGRKLGLGRIDGAEVKP
jgi:hypothetical protein